MSEKSAISQPTGNPARNRGVERFCRIEQKSGIIARVQLIALRIRLFMTRPRSLPHQHSEFIDHAVSVLAEDARIVGVAAGGSYADDRMDEFSDIDLLIAVASDAFPAILDERSRLAAQIAPLLAAFTGEHVGEPRLLICLYGPPLLHVDFKFVDVNDAGNRVGTPVVLWQRGTLLADALRVPEQSFPAPQPQWIEDRFWVWIHYAAAKVARGELFEAYETLSFLRLNALAPLGLVQIDRTPMGVRRIELLAPKLARALERTIVATFDRRSLLRGLTAAVCVYRELREAERRPLQRRSAAEIAAVAYLDSLAARLDDL